MQTDTDIAGAVAEMLHRHYPGHLWVVHASRETGIATVHNLRLSGRWGFVLRLNDLLSDPTLRMVVRAGGELLERWSLSRGPARIDEIAARAVNQRGEMEGGKLD